MAKRPEQPKPLPNCKKCGGTGWIAMRHPCGCGFPYIAFLEDRIGERVIWLDGNNNEVACSQVVNVKRVEQLSKEQDLGKCLGPVWLCVRGAKDMMRPLTKP